MNTTTCKCPDPWCPEHALCGACGGPVVILDEDDPAFCPACAHDVMPVRACKHVKQPQPTSSRQQRQRCAWDLEDGYCQVHRRYCSF
jgi:hypothetical protein